VPPYPAVDANWQLIAHVRLYAPFTRWQRKFLSHTLAVYLCQQTGLGSLRFADLLAT
jgi:hypothetical protein